MTRILRITPQDHVVSLWSGGKTRQIYIHPPGAKYADRDFIFRVSSASVELEESDFTPLPDYQRFLSILKGKMSLTIQGREAVALSPYDVVTFDGGEKVQSQGKCTDFNLMLRKGACTGSLYALHLPENGEISIPPKGGSLVIYCGKGAIRLQGRKGFLICKQEEAAAILEMDEPIQMKAMQSAAFLIAEITLTDHQ